MLDAVGMPKERAGSLFDLADVDKSGLVDFEDQGLAAFEVVERSSVGGSSPTCRLGTVLFMARPRKKAMDVCVKQGEIVNKHLRVEMNVGDVLCYGLDEKLVRSLEIVRSCLWRLMAVLLAFRGL